MENSQNLLYLCEDEKRADADSDAAEDNRGVAHMLLGATRYDKDIEAPKDTGAPAAEAPPRPPPMADAPSGDAPPADGPPSSARRLGRAVSLCGCALVAPANVRGEKEIVIPD